MTDNVLRPRICRECGIEFLGGPRAWYCPGCREERKRKHLQEHRKRKRAGMARAIGSTDHCEMCGAKYTVSSGKQRFCEKCAPLHLKEIDNQQSLEWKQKNPEKIKESKRALSKKKHSAPGKTSGIKYITWDKGHKKWSVKPYINGKQVLLGRFKDLGKAQKELNEFLKQNNSAT